ncbi:rho gtpase-activating protein 68f [Anaeramoeba flamelloides]|uniref:Rho gtpase-activating protein 68f n=1 Tax=Anaeramoeba flamelloides TaxID=1746091 RepID=A0ABQ8XYW2_9EUKA|nr:rho gtpase-activating protein 68f [Anaeramoeba flamelloides]
MDTKEKLYRALFNYKPKKSKKFAFVTGDMIVLTNEKEGCVMCEGRVQDTDRIFRFPRAFVMSDDLFDESVLNVIYQGQLSKKPNKKRTRYKKRFFKLYSSHLFWFKNAMCLDPLGGILLNSCKTIIINNKHKKQFLLKTQEKSWLIKCSDQLITKDWINFLNFQINLSAREKKHENITKHYRETNLNLNLTPIRTRSQTLSHPKSNPNFKQISNNSMCSSQSKLKKMNSPRVVNKRNQSVDKTTKNKPIVKKKEENLNIISINKSTILKIIQGLVSVIETHGINEEGIFRISGQLHEIELLRKDFNEGREIVFKEKSNIHNYSGLLKLILRGFPETILTNNLYEQILRILKYDEEVQLKKLKDQMFILPRLNRTIIKTICSLCIKISNNHEVNKMTIDNLSRIFGPTLCSKKNLMMDPETVQNENKLFKMIITNFDFLFDL